MSQQSNTHSAETENTQPRGLRDMQRDWESWSIGERVSMAMIAACTFTVLCMINWFGAA